MPQAHPNLVDHLLRRLREVQESLGLEPTADDPGVRFADAVDSMGLVEFLAVLAEDCAASPEAIERAAGRRFGTVAELAAALDAAGLRPAVVPEPAPTPTPPPVPLPDPEAWLAATAAGLPAARQPAHAINALLRRPPGWLEEHAGIEQRCLWADDDVLEAAARAARECLGRAGWARGEVGAILVTSEAPPVLLGLAAALHHRLGLPASAVAVEIGGACTGFVAAMWTARRLLPGAGAVLVVAVEAPSRWLAVQPGPAGEAAALFGDGAVACLLTPRPAGQDPRPIRDILLGSAGEDGHLVQARPVPGGGVVVVMDGPALAGRAVRTMAQTVHDLGHRNGLAAGDLEAVVAHGGNGRLPALLARQLGLPVEKVWSETAQTGNLGSASLPVAWAARPQAGPGAVVWTAVGAGLTWGGVLLTGGREG